MSGSLDRIVIVGASLAGLRAAEALREGGFRGSLIIIGEELHKPYDRPPLSKQVAVGTMPAARSTLARQRRIDAGWRLGIAATGLDLAGRCVLLASGERVAFDRLLIATGTRARRWTPAEEGALHGVLTLRTRDDAAALRSALIAVPKRVVVIGGGFTGSEIASACCELGVPVSLIEHSETPLAGALGYVVGRIAASLQSAHGVDLRCGASVRRLEGDGAKHVRRVHLGDGEAIAADLVVVALGSVPNVEWLEGSGLAVSRRGVACDPGCRAYDCYGMAMDDIFVAGDAARFPHPLFNFEFMTLEHWGNAVSGAGVAAHNMLAGQGQQRPHIDVPAFWSSQFDVSIKSVGVPTAGDQVMFVQGSPERGSFVAAYGKRGRLVAAVGFDQGKWLQRYEAMIAMGAEFPCPLGLDAPTDATPVPAEFPSPDRGGLNAFITLSGHSPDDREGTLHLLHDQSQRTGPVVATTESHP